MNNPFDGLKAIVQYRRKPERGYDDWHNMAAFDSRGMAENYANDCSVGHSPWEYRVIDVECPEGD